MPAVGSEAIGPIPSRMGPLQALPSQTAPHRPASVPLHSVDWVPSGLTTTAIPLPKSSEPCGTGGNVRGGATGVAGCDDVAGPVAAVGGPALGETGRGRWEAGAGARAVTDTGTSADTLPTDTRITAPPMPVALMVP